MNKAHASWSWCEFIWQVCFDRLQSAFAEKLWHLSRNLCCRHLPASYRWTHHSGAFPSSSFKRVLFKLIVLRTNAQMVFCLSRYTYTCMYLHRYSCSHEEYDDLEKDKAKYLLYYAAMLQVCACPKHHVNTSTYTFARAYACDIYETITQRCMYAYVCIHGHAPLQSLDALWMHASLCATHRYIWRCMHGYVCM